MNAQDRFKAWARFQAQIREFFNERGYLEVQTPHLVGSGAFESCLDVLKVRGLNQQWELHTSPEIEMKALLAKLRVPLFQICKCFRDDPETGIHLKEFSMLEFYQTNVDYRYLIELTKSLIIQLTANRTRFEQASWYELAKAHTGLDLRKLDTAKSLRECLKQRGNLHINERSSWVDLAHQLWVTQVEPVLNKDHAIIVCDFPEAMCALGKIDRVRGVTERFEIYWRGMEICNGCTEECDSEVLLKRFKRESQARSSDNKQPHPYPNTLFNALKEGIPPCAGVAIGLDRLFWAIFEEIRG